MPVPAHHAAEFAARLAAILAMEAVSPEILIATGDEHVIDEAGLVQLEDEGAEAILIVRGTPSARTRAINKLLALLNTR